MYAFMYLYTIWWLQEGKEFPTAIMLIKNIHGLYDSF